MHCCVFWCEFIDLVVFFGCYCLTHVRPVTLSPGSGSVLREKGKKTRRAKKKKTSASEASREVF